MFWIGGFGWCYCCWILLDSGLSKVAFEGFSSTEEWPNPLKMRIYMTAPLWFRVEVNYDNYGPPSPETIKGSSCASQKLSKGRTKVVDWILHTPKKFSRDTLPQRNSFEATILSKKYCKGSDVFWPYFPTLFGVCETFWYHEGTKRHNSTTPSNDSQRPVDPSPSRQVFDLVGLWDWWMARWWQRLINSNHQWNCNFNVTLLAGG